MWVRDETPPHHWCAGYEGPTLCGVVKSSLLSVDELTPDMKVCHECLVLWSIAPNISSTVI